MADDAFEKIDLPSGGWVALRDPLDLTEHERRPVREAQLRLGFVLSGVEGGLTSERIADLIGVPEALALALVSEWSFDGPVTVESLRNLKGRDYDAVMKAAVKHESILLPNFTDPGDPDDPETPANPTGASSD